MGDGSEAIKKWVFDPDYALMSQLGINKFQVQDSILGKVQNAWLADARINGEAITVVTRLDGKTTELASFDPQKQSVVTAEGRKILLSSIGRWTQVEAPEVINHVNSYKVQTANFPILNPKDVDKIVEKSKPILEKISKSYPQYIVKSSGESLQEVENKEWILNALLACLVGIYFILVFGFYWRLYLLLYLFSYSLKFFFCLLNYFF